MDIQKLFETDLANAMAAKPDIAQRVGAKFQFNVTGEGGGQWFVDASRSGPSVVPGNPGGATCTLSISAQDFEQLLQNPSSGMSLFFSGRLSASGDVMQALKLQELFKAL